MSREQTLRTIQESPRLSALSVDCAIVGARLALNLNLSRAEAQTLAHGVLPSELIEQLRERSRLASRLPVDPKLRERVVVATTVVQAAGRRTQFDRQELASRAGRSLPWKDRVRQALWARTAEFLLLWSVGRTERGVRRSKRDAELVTASLDLAVQEHLHWMDQALTCLEIGANSRAELDRLDLSDSERTEAVAHVEALVSLHVNLALERTTCGRAEGRT